MLNVARDSNRCSFQVKCSSLARFGNESFSDGNFFNALVEHKTSREQLIHKSIYDSRINDSLTGLSFRHILFNVKADYIRFLNFLNMYCICVFQP